MKPLRPAKLDAASRQRTINDLLAKWRNGDPDIRQLFKAANYTCALAAISDYMDEMERNERVYLNHRYQVHVRQCGDNLVHLSIRRLDRQPIHDWRDIQEIKNQLLGPECEAVELYPAESRRVDAANQFHIWGHGDPKFRFPFGFNHGRFVTDESLAGSVNRPLSESDKNQSAHGRTSVPTEAGI